LSTGSGEVYEIRKPIAIQLRRILTGITAIHDLSPLLGQGKWRQTKETRVRVQEQTWTNTATNVSLAITSK
jgi:hypothetical protein